jgi:hypothetical protein
MAEPFLFVAIPTYDGQVAIEHLHAIVQLAGACEAEGIGCHVETLDGDRIIQRARARLAKAFLAHADATHMLFVDADIAFPPGNILRLLRAEKAVVAGVYPVKNLDWARIRAAALAGAEDIQAAAATYVVRFLPNAENRVEVEGGFAPVAYCGSGVMLIRREVVEKVAEAHPELVADLEELGGTTPMLFEPMVEPETGEYLSEDYAFCRRWRDLGGEVWVDVESRYAHIGHAVYAGSLIQALKPG